MTVLRYYEDPYLKSVTATVTGIEADWIEFDQTIFYPEGGGQPGDTGTLSSEGDEISIIDTRKGDAGIVRHQLANSNHSLKTGDLVTIELDWTRRFAHMRMHTALHLLGSLIPVPVTGGSVGSQKSRLDFDLGDHVIDKDTLTREMNQLIEAGHDLSFESITDAMLDEQPDLVRTMSVSPPRGSGTIRMVRIKDVDYQPCGGTHLHNVAEIGPVRISKIESKGKRNRRVHLVFQE